MSDKSMAQPTQAIPSGSSRRDNAARLKLLGGLLRLDALRPGGFTVHELAEYAQVEHETTRAFLGNKGPGFADIVPDRKMQAKPDGSGRPANLYRVNPASRAALFRHVADIRRPFAEVEESSVSSPADLFAPIELLEQTVLELEEHSGDPDVWRDRLSEARLELEGAMADLRTLQSDRSSHAADFGLRLGRAQVRVAAVERAGPPVTARQRKPVEDPLGDFVMQFGHWLQEPAAMLEPVLLLLSGTNKQAALKPVLDTCRAADVHVAHFDLVDMTQARRAEFYGRLDYLRCTTPLAASDVLLAVDGTTQIAQPLAQEFCQLYELGRWKDRVSVMENFDRAGLKADWLRRFYLAQSASYLQSPEIEPHAATKIAYVTRVSSALSAFVAADGVDSGGYLLSRGADRHRQRWLGAAHEMMGDMICVDFKPNAAIRNAFAGSSVDYMAADDLSNSFGSGA